MLMKKSLNEVAILQRMSREESTNVKGGGSNSSTILPAVGSLCLQPTLSSLCDCLLAGCGCLPSQRACDRCLAGTEPSDK